MKSLEKKYVVNANVEKVWDALTNPMTIDRWGAGPAVMDEKVGTEFKLWGGDIRGKNIEAEKNKRLKQEWFGGDWKEPSVVEFILKDMNGKTEVTLLQTNIPDEEADDINTGWDDYYMGEIVKLFE
jgi:activator of HSP90 ATPase